MKATTPSHAAKALSILLFSATVLLVGVSSAWADSSPDEIAYLQQVVAASPQDPDAHFNLAMAYARTPDLEKGWDELQVVKKLDPAYADKVIARFEPLAAANPNNIEVLFRLAFAYYFKGYQVNDPVYKAKAKSAFEAILAVDPKYVWALDYLAYLTYNAGDLDGALALARRATAADPDNAVAHFLLGEGLFKERQPLAAALEMAHAMQLRGTADWLP
ncbi:MAG: tetratricopeptide repeat protein [Cyanobacteria bacterium REEB65]|nr:tetratricopeptide repeat protein [Cyanobacteria bacterium REEB65]